MTVGYIDAEIIQPRGLVDLIKSFGTLLQILGTHQPGLTNVFLLRRDITK